MRALDKFASAVIAASIAFVVGFVGVIMFLEFVNLANQQAAGESNSARYAE